MERIPSSLKAAKSKPRKRSGRAVTTDANEAGPSNTDHPEPLSIPRNGMLKIPSGLSRNIREYSGVPGQAPRVLGPTQQREEAAKAKRKADEAIAGLAGPDREKIRRLAVVDTNDTPDAAEEEAWAEYPVGAEGHLPSISDSEEEEGDAPDFENRRARTATTLYDNLIDTVNGVGHMVNTAERDRTAITNAERRARHAQAWASQMDELVREFLEWQRSGLHVDPPEPFSDVVMSHSVVDVWGTSSRNPHFPNFYVHHHANVCLIRRGALSNSPELVTIAFSLHTLELYRCLRNRKPSLGIQGFTKTLCDLHLYPWRSIYSRQFSEAFDVYLEIRRRIDALVNIPLGRSGPNARMLEACPPCFYKLEDDPELEHQLSIDGNSSLKRFATRQTIEEKTLETSYLLPRSEVDKCADEVVHRKAKKKKRTNVTIEDANEDVDMDCADEEMEIVKAGALDAARTAIDNVVSACVERWKANADDAKKGMFDCFDESGIFVAVCRHGIILVACDMWRSGELSKYPLAILKKLQEIYPDAKMVGYDIGCSFKKSAQNSSFGNTLRVRFVIPSMHGYAHNRGCQLGHHPRYVEGSGIEDFEGCERCFSSSNECARLTRHASAFHRHQAIDAHFTQWDSDKYANLGAFIRSNYRQALLIITEITDTLDNWYKMKKTTPAHLIRWFREESAYLQTVGKQREVETRETLAMAYVEALEELRAARVEETDEVSTLPASGAVPATELSTGNAGRKVRAAKDRQDKALARVEALEEKLEPDERWKHTDKLYQETLKKMARHRYVQALDNLERLVVQRMFELQKTHLASTGYKLRTQIGKHLQNRAKAIKTAVNKFNAAAAGLDPPREPVSLKDILAKTFLAEFDMLRDSQHDVLEQEWAKPDNRLYMDNYFKLKRAHEEVSRLNIEIRRLKTWMRDEEAKFKAVIEELRQSDPALAHEVSRRLRMRQFVHIRIEKQLKEVEGWPGFTGTKACGTRVGAPPTVPAPVVGSDVGGSGGAGVNADAPRDEGDDTASVGSLDEERRDVLDGLETALTHLNN